MHSQKLVASILLTKPWVKKSKKRRTLIIRKSPLRNEVKPLRFSTPSELLSINQFLYYKKKLHLIS